MSKKVSSWVEKFLRHEWIIVTFIFLLTLVIRLIGLATTPNGFHIDEVVSGYIGRFILLNGKDIYGNSWPLLYFNSFGDYRVILPMYINGLSTFIFGVNIFAVRFPTAFIGSLIVFPLYSISRRLVGKTFFAFVPLLILAFLPWHIVLSRATAEGVVGLTVFVTGLACMLRSLDQKGWKYIIFAGICFFATYFLYPTFRVLVPLSIMPLVFILSQNKYKYIVLLGFFTLFTLWVGTTVWGEGRYEQTSLLTSKQVSSSIAEKEKALSFGEGDGHVWSARVFDNKVVGYTQQFLSNYFSYLSPGFLFFNTGLPDRYVIPDVGVSYFVLVIFLVGLLVNSKNKTPEILYWYVWYLLGISILPGALTVDDIPNIHRVLFMMVPIVLLCGVGFANMFQLFEKNKFIQYLLVVCVLVIGTGEFVYFTHQYIVQEPAYHSQSRDDGYITYVSQLQKWNNTRTQVIAPVFEAAPIYYLFFTNNFDRKYAGAFSDGMRISQIGSIHFVGDNCPLEWPQKYQILPGTIVVEEGECKKNPFETNAIYRHDSTKAFAIFGESGK